MTSQGTEQHYKHITFAENRARIKLLNEFRDLVELYFDNSTLNLLDGNYVEKPEASDAKKDINLVLSRAYTLIRLADIKTYTASNTVLASSGRGKSMDIIMNIFNLGRNDIPPETAIEYIDRAIRTYRSNRVSSFLRTINPFFWMRVMFSNIARRSSRAGTEKEN